MPQPRIKVCETCIGSEPLLCDLEDMSACLGVKVKYGPCLEKCKSGPNCLADVVEDSGGGRSRRRRKHNRSSSSDGENHSRRRKRKSDASSHEQNSNRRTRKIFSKLWTFEDSIKVLCAVVGKEQLDIPDIVATRARLRSDAMRALSRIPTTMKHMTRADMLLSEAVSHEAKNKDFFQSFRAEKIEQRMQLSRLSELLLLRGEVRGSKELRLHDLALADLDSVIHQEPKLWRPWIEKAKICRRTNRLADAITCLEKALELGTESGTSSSSGLLGLHHTVRAWVDRSLIQLKERLQQDVTAPREIFGTADAADEGIQDSGSGGGWWKVRNITGISGDTCLYELENYPPSVPHPCPLELWHVQVRFGDEVREYTPVSDSVAWEKGHLLLLVKTYETGSVSKRFAMLRPANNHQDALEQNCWLQVSVPCITLNLSSIAEDSIMHLGIIVGGTGVAPALQLLRQVVNPSGVFGNSCKASMLYSSRSIEQVLMLDELRDMVAKGNNRIKICHTLTRSSSPTGENACVSSKDGYLSFSGHHHRFCTKLSPFKPSSGPLQISAGEEAEFRGRVRPPLLSEVLPRAGPGVRVIVSGPPRMWEDVRKMLTAEGFADDTLIELKAFS